MVFIACEMPPPKVQNIFPFNSSLEDDTYAPMLNNYAPMPHASPHLQPKDRTTEEYVKNEREKKERSSDVVKKKLGEIPKGYKIGDSHTGYDNLTNAASFSANSTIGITTYTRNWDSYLCDKEEKENQSLLRRVLGSMTTITEKDRPSYESRFTNPIHPNVAQRILPHSRFVPPRCDETLVDVDEFTGLTQECRFSYASPPVPDGMC
jgi:hypothetical protein